jgi:hypothetical protein
MHGRIYGSMKWQTAEFPVPLGVKALMSKPIDTITFQFRNPVTCLRGMLQSGPLAAEKTNLAFRPEPSPFYDDYVRGERMERIYAKLPPNTDALTCILYFDRCSCTYELCCVVKHMKCQCMYA